MHARAYIPHRCPRVVLRAVRLFAAGFLTAAALADRPNILFIMTDDHAGQALSAYDGTLLHTPHLDRLARDGVLFENSFVGNSICAPSRATLLTGLHSHRNGKRTNRDTFDGSQDTFPKRLQAAGYQTALIGKWHLRSDPTGFDYWNILPGQGAYYNPDFIEMGTRRRHEGYCTTLTTDFALRWLRQQREPDRPFCLLVHHKAPHRPWQPDLRHLDEFAERVFPLPGTFFDTYEGRTAAARQRLSIRTRDMDLRYDLKLQHPDIPSRFGRFDHTARMTEAQARVWRAHYEPIAEAFLARSPAGPDLARWKFQRYLRDYLACIRGVDEQVGRLLDALDTLDLADNTLVVYTSDQGFYLGEHGWFDKRFMYEESMRTPLLMRLPTAFDVTAPRRVSALVQNIDTAPTLLELAGLPVPAAMQGRSLRPLLQGAPPANWRSGLYYHYSEFPNEHGVKQHLGLRTDRYKLIHFYHDIDAWELFDLQTDPRELTNLIHVADRAPLVDQLKSQLRALQDHYGDVAPLP